VQGVRAHERGGAREALARRVVSTAPATQGRDYGTTMPSPAALDAPGGEDGRQGVLDRHDAGIVVLEPPEPRVLDLLVDCEEPAVEVHVPPQSRPRSSPGHQAGERADGEGDVDPRKGVSVPPEYTLLGSNPLG